MSSHPDTFRRGFTLVELLVVIAVVALLIGVLLPALAGARASGWQIKDASLQKQLLLGMSAWANDNDLATPGLNTSGITLASLDVTKLDRASKPVQSFDWISAALADVLPDDRQERFLKILEEYGNPANKRTVSASEIDFDADTELEDLVNEAGGFVAAPSYFMAASWQWAGPSSTGNVPGSRYEQPAGEQDVVQAPSSWFPRITSVGAASDKAAISNAVYSIDGSDQLKTAVWLDPDEEVYGAFCHSTPCRAASKNFTDDLKSESINLSYPHKGRMNAGYWDGHVGTLMPAESQDPGLWYPRGAIMGDGGATEVARDLYAPGDKIN